MNSSATHIANQVKALNNYPTGLSTAGKSLTTQTKSLGEGGSDLAAWYEDAYLYYNAVMSGQEPQPDEASWNQFLDWMQYAASELGMGDSTSWGEESSMPSMEGSPMEDPSGEGVPEGASLGTLDNIVWNSAEATIAVPGDGRPNDIWSNTITLDLPSISGRISSEVTTDTRWNPPEEVLKVVATDPATGAESVYFIHDYQDATIKVRTSVQTQLTDNTGLVGWEQYLAPVDGATEGTETETVSESSVEGQLMTDENGETYYLYDGSGTDNIEFYPQGSGVDGEQTFHDVQGNSVLTVRNTDKVEVLESKKEKDWDYCVIVTHSDGSQDQYRIHKEYDVKINAVPEHVTFKSRSGSDEKLDDGKTAKEVKGEEGQLELPDEFAKNFTLNGLESVKKSDFEEAKEKAAEEKEKNKPPEVKYPATLVSLADAMGLTEEKLVNLLEADYGLKLKDENDNGTISAAEVEISLKKANFPPTRPDEKLIEFFKKHDVDLKNFLDATSTSDNSSYIDSMEKVTERLANLLNPLYEEKITHNSSPTFWWEANDMWFDGDKFEPFKDGSNSKVESKINRLYSGDGDIQIAYLGDGKYWIDGIGDASFDQAVNAINNNIKDDDDDDDVSESYWDDMSEADRGDVNSDPFGDTGDY